MDEVQQSEDCFQFENHKNVICENLTKYFEKGTFVNVTIVCDGEPIMAHKVVLSACSPFFEKILINRYEPHPVLILSDISKTDMLLLLEFMYKGHIPIASSVSSSLLKVAKKLQIIGLDYDKIDATQPNATESVNNSSEYFSNVLTHTDSNEIQPVVEQNMIHEEAPRWLKSTSSPRVKKGERGKKVINPFAKKSKSSSDSDATLYSCDPHMPLKNSFHHLAVASMPQRADSDVEFIENDTAIVVISDTLINDSASPSTSRKKWRKGQSDYVSRRKVDISSDESDLVASTPKKHKKARRDSDVSSTAIVNPVALSRCERKVVNPIASTSGQSNGNSFVAKSSRKANEESKEQQETAVEPFEGFVTTPFSKLVNFCLICKKFTKNGPRHIKTHKIPPRRKMFKCQKCFRVFGREKPLELHKCEAKTKKKV